MEAAGTPMAAGVVVDAPEGPVQTAAFDLPHVGSSMAMRAAKI